MPGNKEVTGYASQVPIGRFQVVCRQPQRSHCFSRHFMRDSKFGLNADNNLTDEGIFFLRLDVASGDQAGAHNLMLILIFNAFSAATWTPTIFNVIKIR